MRLNGYQFIMIDDISDPTSVDEALDSPQWKYWKRAMKMDFFVFAEEQDVDARVEEYMSVLTTKWTL